LAQFDVYRTRRGLVVDCQSDHLSALNSRLVIPLRPASSEFPAKPRLNPTFNVAGEPMILITELAAAIAKSELGEPFVTLSAERDRIIAALDLLITGV
jgi:toxin CcdB